MQINYMRIFERADEEFVKKNSMGLTVAILMKEFYDLLSKSISMDTYSKCNKEMYLSIPQIDTICEHFNNKKWCEECGQYIGYDISPINQILVFSFLWAVSRELIEADNFQEQSIEQIYKEMRGRPFGLPATYTCYECDDEQKRYLGNEGVHGECFDFDTHHIIAV